MILETTIALIIIFAILVIFHELGHFTVAKLVGIRVEEFALGFGPRLLTLFKKGDTEYTLHPVPLGGFVKLAGMEPNEVDIPDGFQAQAIWKRALVIFAGPFASFLLAVIVFVLIGLYWGFPNPSQPEDRVGMVQPKTEAARIGLKAGDRILEIDGVKITHGKQMTDIIHSRPGQRIKLLVSRNGDKLTIVAHPRWLVQYLGARWSFMSGDQAVVEGTADLSAAKKAGIHPGDKLISINGKKINGGADMVAAIEANKDKKAKIELERNKKIVSVEVDPSIFIVRFMGVDWKFPGSYVEVDKGEIDPSSPAGKAGVKLYDQLVSINGKKITTGEQMLKIIRSADKGKLDFVINREGEAKPIHIIAMPTANRASLNPENYGKIETKLYDRMGLLGFQPLPSLEKVGFGESVTRGLQGTWNIGVQVLQTLTSKRIKDEVGGPVMIARVTASSVALGPYWVVVMLGSLSMSLAIINLIPLPVVDGGHLAILAVEAIRRKRLTQEQMQAWTMVGIVILVGIVVLVLWSDIFKITQGLVPQ